MEPSGLISGSWIITVERVEPPVLVIVNEYSMVCPAVCGAGVSTVLVRLSDETSGTVTEDGPALTAVPFDAVAVAVAVFTTFPAVTSAAVTV